MRRRLRTRRRGGSRALRASEIGSPDTAPESDARTLLDASDRSHALEGWPNFGVPMLTRPEERRELVSVDGLREKEFHDAIVEQIAQMRDGAPGNQNSMRVRGLLRQSLEHGKSRCTVELVVDNDRAEPTCTHQRKRIGDG